MNLLDKVEVAEGSKIVTTKNSFGSSGSQIVKGCRGHVTKILLEPEVVPPSYNIEMVPSQIMLQIVEPCTQKFSIRSSTEKLDISDKNTII